MLLCIDPVIQHKRESPAIDTRWGCVSVVKLEKMGRVTLSQIDCNHMQNAIKPELQPQLSGHHDVIPRDNVLWYLQVNLNLVL